MAFLQTSHGSINERFIIRLNPSDDGKVTVYYSQGEGVAGATADSDDVIAFLKKTD